MEMMINRAFTRKEQTAQRMGNFFVVLCCLYVLFLTQSVSAQPRNITDFNKDWKFYLGNDSLASQPAYNDAAWRNLPLPHDWSIEGDFNRNDPATTQAAALPTGIGWYRKTFVLPSN